MAPKDGYTIGVLRKKGYLEVAAGKKIYFEQRGNLNGIPVVYNHGGPGNQSKESDSQWFDPKYYNIILYDQRGTGNSLPSVFNPTVNPADFQALTVADMVSDLEKLREHLGFKQWIIFGGSWGSTLSLSYAQKHPDKVLGLILFGIFLNQPEEMTEYYSLEKIKQRFGEIGVQALNVLINYARSKNINIAPNDPKEFIFKYFQLCVIENDKIAQYLWEAFELLNSDPSTENLRKIQNPPSSQDVTSYYISHSIFETIIFREAYEGFNVLEPKLIEAIKDINIHIIQGNADTEAPPLFAKKLVYALIKVNHNLCYQFIEDANHWPNSFEGPMGQALLESTDSFIVKYRPAITTALNLHKLKLNNEEPLTSAVNDKEIIRNRNTT